MNRFDELWYEKCFDSVSQFLAILDKNGHILRLNRAACELTGLSLPEVADIPLWQMPWDVLKTQNQRVLKHAFQQALDGRAVREELITRRGRQVEKIVVFSILPIQNKHTAPLFFMVEARDETTEHITKDELFQSEARFKSIYEETGIGIVIKGVNGKILDCNPAFQSMVGYTGEELSQMNYLKITHPADKNLSRKLFFQLIAGERSNYQIEKRYLHKDGQITWGRMTASLVRDKSGAGKFVIGMVENITAKKQIEAELNELQRRLMQGRDLERVRLAQDLHDGPLQAIIALSYQTRELEGNVQNPDDRTQLKAVRASLQELMKSIRSICGELRPPTLAPFGLEKTIRSHVEEFRSVHPEIKVSIHLAQDGLSVPENIRIVLFRIYQEALNNIVRHSQAKEVKIRFQLTDEKIVLEIKDDGMGFELPKQWLELARQGHLGLVGAMERAKEVGGKLEVYSCPGQGTRIRVSVPFDNKAISNEDLEEE